MPSQFEAERQIVEIGRRIWERGYVASNDGNLSIRIDSNRIVVTPTGQSKGFLKTNDLVVVNLKGQKLAGRLEPTSELAMHLFAYNRRPEIGSVVHAHPPKATGFAVAGVALAQCILPEVILSLGGVPLAEYATPSTPEVSQSISGFIDTYSAMLLKNHGVLTLGEDIYQAYYRMETVEHFAAVSLTALQLGGASPLSKANIEDLVRVREKLGIAGPVDICYDCGACAPSRNEASGSTDRPSEQPVLPASEKAGDPATDQLVEAVLEEVRRRTDKA